VIKLLFAAALLFAGPDGTPKSLTEGEQAQLQQNLNRGLDLYRYDQSAWHVTDAAVAALPESSMKETRGWVTTPAPNGLRTTFFGEADGDYYAIYSAVWTGSSIEDPKIYPLAERNPVTTEERRLILARKIALDSQQSLGMCNSAPPNVIVVPSSDAAIQVYVMTPQTENDVFPLGGHHRIDVVNGNVVAKRSFTNSCLNMERGNAVGLMITHLLDPVPTEIHVFSVFAMGLPLYVSVNDGRVYVVEISGGQPRARVVGNVNDSANY
jgi:hypothetical protein